MPALSDCNVWFGGNGMLEAVRRSACAVVCVRFVSWQKNNTARFVPSSTVISRSPNFKVGGYRFSPEGKQRLEIFIRGKTRKSADLPKK